MPDSKNSPSWFVTHLGIATTLIILLTAAQPQAIAQGSDVASSVGKMMSAHHWTHTVRIRNMVLKYDTADGSGVMESSNGSILKSYSAGGFAAGWTHIVYTPNGTLFYNSSTGRGSIVRFANDGSGNTIKTYPSDGAPAFATGWTNIRYTPGGIQFYNSVTKAHAVGDIDSSGNFTTR
jgi:hypothetical protein